MRPHKLAEPRRLRQPTLIFVNSMSDLFLDNIPDDYRDQIVDVIASTPRHIFQTLTKRPETAARYFATRPVPKNLWLGVTVGGAPWKHRIDTLRTIRASVRFLSIEPLIQGVGALDLADIHWVIVGGESGTHLCDPSVCADRGLVQREGRTGWAPREDRMDWVRSIRDQCSAANVAFLFKQWGGSRGHLAGRTLDGRVHDEYPTPDRRHPFATLAVHPLPPVQSRQRALPIAP
jgi:protein gp37